jgi:hypothetical protein
MTADAVPARASSAPIVRTRWFRFLARTALALLSFWMLWFAADRYTAFAMDAAANFRFDDSLWLAWAGATVAAGLLFGLATSLPFAKVRFLPNRLLLAGLALVPVAHSWWVLLEGHAASGGWLGRSYWFDEVQIQFVMAALAGVAIASGLRAASERPASGAIPAGASSDSVIHTRWFGFLVRAALALLAFWTLSFAVDRFTATFARGIEFVMGEEVPTERLYDGASWLSWGVAMIAAGLLFGLAAWLPFAKIRFQPSRLLLAAVTLVPVAHFWWAYLEGHGSGGWLGRSYWFDAREIQFVMAALAGVAIASGLRGERGRQAP